MKGIFKEGLLIRISNLRCSLTIWPFKASNLIEMMPWALFLSLINFHRDVTF